MHAWRAGLAALLVAWGPAAFSTAEEGRDDGQPSETTSQVDSDLTSAQQTMRTFLKSANARDWENAAKCLDFSELPADTSQRRKQDLAFRLKEVVDRMAVIPVDDISTDADGGAYEFPPGESPPPIVLDKTEGGVWLFTTDTVGRIDDLYEEYKGKEKVAGLNWVEKMFGGRLTGTTFLLPDYQWVYLLVLIFVGFVADRLARWLLIRLTKTWFKLKKAEAEVATEKRVWKPMGLLAQALVWYFGTSALQLPGLLEDILLIGLKFFAVVAAVWTSFRLIDLLATFLLRKTVKTETKFDDLLVPLVSKSLKVFAVVVGALMCAEAFDLPIAGLLGGIGIGGAAIAFASKDAISNLFGSVTVLTDRPFEIGDWIITEGVEGSVESVGFRSTRIRTFYNSVITLPNSRLTTASVDNMGRRRYRRIKTMLGVQYDTTPEQIDAFCEGVRELIRRHPYTRKDYYHVYFNEFADSSLNILLYCFLECPDWGIELREKHRLFCDIVKLAQSLDVEFAFPTSTLHMYQQEPRTSGLPLDLSNAKRAGARLAAEIAGPPLPADQRPGPVEYRGPSDDADDSGDDGDGANGGDG